MLTKAAGLLSSYSNSGRDIQGCTKVIRKIDVAQLELRNLIKDYS
jgi:hypothetical protein